MQEWKRKGAPAPLAFTQHMTNTLLLPFNTWNDADLDMEWRWYDEVKWTWGPQTKPIPFPPDLLLTETTGRQTGSFSHALFGVSSLWNETDRTEQTARTEWGMRAVHEILRSPNREPAKRLEKALRDFGYGTEACRVVNYWSDDPPLSVSDPRVKWLLLVRKRDRSLFLVLQSWRKSGTNVEIALDPKRLGFTPGLEMLDVETGKRLRRLPSGLRFEARLPGPYGTRVLSLGR
jgi:hypothetical protein